MSYPIPDELSTMSAIQLLAFMDFAATTKEMSELGYNATKSQLEEAAFSRDLARRLCAGYDLDEIFREVEHFELPYS